MVVRRRSRDDRTRTLGAMRCVGRKVVVASRLANVYLGRMRVARSISVALWLAISVIGARVNSAEPVSPPPGAVPDSAPSAPYPYQPYGPPPGGNTASPYGSPSPGYPPPGYGYPPPGYPPQGYGYPPPGYFPQGYGYPPPGYPPQGYGYPPQAYGVPPPSLPYRKGDRVPAGYHVEEKPRKGLVVTGVLLTAIPYAFGLFAATAANFDNQSGWLAVPYLGPWLTIGRRSYGDCDRTAGSSHETARCAGDVLAAVGLVFDGVVQAVGGTLLLVGVLTPKEELVRDGQSLRVTPIRIGSGYGLGMRGAF